MKPRILAIIPARGGSKGLPGKNIAPLAGKPLIAHTVAAALACPDITRTVVSTDDQAIAAAARAAGADVPFTRPPELATETAASFDVVRHAVEFCEEAEHAKYDAVVLLQPTSPLRTTADISGAIKLFQTSGAPSVVSVCELEHPVSWVVALAADGTISRPFADAAKSLRDGRQQHLKHYRFNGAVYIYRRDLIAASPTGITPETRAFVMPADRSIDIDTALDLAVAAEWLHKTHKSR